MDGLMKYLAKNMRYPAKAKANNVQGRVVLKFIVDKQGCISDVKVVKSLDPECDAEAIRLIKNMPKWNPGKIDGEPVDRCSFTCPVIFKLSP
jgi:protein TonB